MLLLLREQSLEMRHRLSLRKIKEIVPVPVLAGSGVKKENIREQLEIADGCIVGSGLKEGGLISNPVSYALTHDLVLAK